MSTFYGCRKAQKNEAVSERRGGQDMGLFGQQLTSLQERVPILLPHAGRIELSWDRHGGNAGSYRTGDTKSAAEEIQ